MTIRSGGQSGVDRAALVAAVDFGLLYTGWCPKGGWAEDLPTPPGIMDLFPDLTETPSAEPEQRTAWNVRDSGATIILARDLFFDGHPGTRFTRICAESIFRKPLLIAELDGNPPSREAVAWLRNHLERSTPEPFSLNVAGPRESEAPGILQLARDYLLVLFEKTTARTPPPHRETE